MPKQTLELNCCAVKLLPMHFICRMAAVALLALSWTAHAGQARIVKVLPHFLDKSGRHTLHPSLFERDGYQAYLKSHRDLCSGMRFDVQWKGRKLQNGQIKLEVRGANTPPRQTEIFSTDLKGGGVFSQWSALKIAGEDFRRIGSIIAWRISLWDGDEQLAEQKSFLW
jgi:hypothetical protein